MSLRTSNFDYPLDSGLIAQQPCGKRDESRLMVLNRRNGQASHHRFAELPQLLRAGDLLVLNDTRVIPAKFSCRRRTGGRIEGLFLRERGDGCWEVLLKNASRCRVGESLELAGADGTALELRRDLGEGKWLLAVQPHAPAFEILQQAGEAPLPPYIHRNENSGETADLKRYQTVYAAQPGAVAAPTAGLHFTQPLMESLRQAGVTIAKVTLHVGLGTFGPVKAENLADHRMHAEWCDLSAETAAQLNTARREHRRVVAVGTTSVRVLETAAGSGQAFEPVSGWTDIFLYPPARFRAVDALITNFHLPRSTLLMLVAAFCSPGRTDGLNTILAAYAAAQSLRYRFYSYGDAMLIE